MTVSRPKPYNDRAPSEYADWPEDKRWALKTLDAARSQLVDIQVATGAYFIMHLSKESLGA